VATRHQVVLLPGAILPAEPAYAALLQELGERVDAVTKDLEVYAGEERPPDFSLDTEVEGILREADGHGFAYFHLVGYSGGGASSIAFAALHGNRLLSLALPEPAWAGNERTPAEETHYFALGGRSNPDYYGRMAERLAAVFPDFTLDTFAERHHFDPPHRIEPDRLASSLLTLWQRAEP
jgi:pimeloyl-ACP methyl ester carboxylesterase